MNLRLRPISLALIASLCSVCNALSLPEAYQKALLQDPTIRASRAALASGMERVPQARSQLFPTIQASVSRTKNDLDTTREDFSGQNTTTNSKYYSDSKSVVLRQPILNLSRRANLSQAHELEKEAVATHQRNMQDLLIRLSTAYSDVLLSEQQLVLAISLKQQEQTLLDAARKNFAAGAGTRTDIDEVQTRLDMSIVKELEAKQQRDYARRQLEVLIGEPISDIASIQTQNAQALAQSLPSLQVTLDQAQARSPEINILKARIAAAQKEVSKVQAGHYPTLEAIVQWSDSGNDSVTNPNTKYVNKSAGLQLVVPIYQGGVVNSQVRQALAEQTRAQETLEATSRDLSLRLHKEYRGVTEGQLRVQALLQAEHSARQMLISTQRSREGGFRTTLDVINAEQQIAVVVRDLLSARLQALIALLRLKALSGEDPQAIMDEVAATFTN